MQDEVKTIDKKRMKNNLHEFNTNIHEFAEKSYSGIFIIQDNKIRFCNKSFEEISGQSKDEIKDVNFYELISEDIRDHAREMIMQIEEGQIPIWQQEMSFKKKDGTRVLLNHAFTGIMYCGKPAVICSVTGISPFKEFEDELRIRQEAFESSVTPIAIMDLEGKIASVNWSLLNLLGYIDEEDMLNQFIEDFWISEKFLPHESIVMKTQEEGMWRGELIGEKGGGTRFYVDASISLILNKEDHAIGIVGYFVDITERKRTEERMREVTKMTALGEFVAGAAHEINNPLGIIAANAQYLLSKFKKTKLKDFSSKDIKVVKDSIEMIHKHTLRCGGITQKLLTFGERGEEGEKTLIDINEVIKEVLSIMGPQLKVSNINVEKQLAMLPKALGNSDQMNQVFINLILNAQQAMPRGGKLIIKTMRIDKGMIRAEIFDSGIGIPEQIIDRVFEPFFTTRKDQKSTGLGLSVSYSIIKSHGGDIALASQPRKGTTAIINLPVYQ